MQYIFVKYYESYFFVHSASGPTSVDIFVQVAAAAAAERRCRPVCYYTYLLPGRTAHLSTQR